MKNILLVLAIVLGGAAQAQTYECTMTNRGNGGAIGEKMLFSIQPTRATGTVYDGIIASVHEGPIPAEVKKRSGTQWRYYWSVKGVPTGNIGKASLTYRATLDIARNEVRVSGNLAGYDNNISGSGPCKIIRR